MNDNAVIYARFSSDRQREASIEGQIRECTEYAKKNNITIVGSYIDRALSASKDTDKRLDFQRMIRDSSKGLFNTVLVWKLDRFARNRYDSAYYKSMRILPARWRTTWKCSRSRPRSPASTGSRPCDK